MKLLVFFSLILSILLAVNAQPVNNVPQSLNANNGVQQQFSAQPTNYQQAQATSNNANAVPALAVSTGSIQSAQQQQPLPVATSTFVANAPPAIVPLQDNTAQQPQYQSQNNQNTQNSQTFQAQPNNQNMPSQNFQAQQNNQNQQTQPQQNQQAQPLQNQQAQPQQNQQAQLQQNFQQPQGNQQYQNQNQQQNAQQFQNVQPQQQSNFQQYPQPPQSNFQQQSAQPRFNNAGNLAPMQFQSQSNNQANWQSGQPQPLQPGQVYYAPAVQTPVNAPGPIACFCKPLMPQTAVAQEVYTEQSNANGCNCAPNAEPMPLTADQIRADAALKRAEISTNALARAEAAKAEAEQLRSLRQQELKAHQLEREEQRVKDQTFTAQQWQEEASRLEAEGQAFESQYLEAVAEQKQAQEESNLIAQKAAELLAAKNKAFTNARHAQSKARAKFATQARRTTVITTTTV